MQKKILSLAVMMAMVAAYGNMVSWNIWNLFEATAANAAVATSTQTIMLTVTSTITLTLATSTVNLGTLTPGSPNTATTSLSVTTNEYNGWYLSVKRDDAASTLNMNGAAVPNITFPDATAWTYAAPNGTTAALVGANLSFRVYQTGTDAALYSAALWGADDTAPNALLAGFPTASQRIAGVSSYVGAAQPVVYGFRADAPGTQQSGVYSGTITFTALTNP